MDVADQDPIESIIKLARGMMPDRRSRFLDAACGDQPGVRAEVEARLNAGGRPEVAEGSRNSTPDEMCASPSSSIESVALEAVSAAQDLRRKGKCRGR